MEALWIASLALAMTAEEIGNRVAGGVPEPQNCIS